MRLELVYSKTVFVYVFSNIEQFHSPRGHLQTEVSTLTVIVMFKLRSPLFLMSAQVLQQSHVANTYCS